MDKCVICHKNVPVIYTTRYEGGESKSEGLCLSCAYHRHIPGMSGMLTQSGINESNVDEITERINEVMEQMEEADPEELFNMMTNGMEGLQNQFPGLNPFINPMNAGFENNSDEEADEEDDSSALSDPSTPEQGNMPFAVQQSGEESDDNDEGRSNLPSWLLGARGQGGQTERKRPKRRKFLDQFGRNLNTVAKNNMMDPLVGREKELDRVIQILNRRSKNNPVLLGQPGVGKTAIAEGLASRIVEGQVPAKLLDMEVYLLDMTAMVAGTQFRGQFESRMKGVVDEASGIGNIVLVIDELHNIMGAGDAEGAMNAANILKPALARGEIRVLGSTTLDEYRRFIEKDSALDRRFQQVIVEEPSVDESIEILKGLRSNYEEHHHCKYPDNVLEAAVKMSDRYITDRFLPDKAIDLIDEAGSRANLADTRLVDAEKLRNETEQLKVRQERMKQADVPSDDEKQEAFYREQANIRSDLMKSSNELQKLEEDLQPTEISVEDIASIVEMWTGVPVRQLTESEQAQLLNLEERLHKRVVGQNEAVSALSRAIRRGRAGLKARHKPSSFIFVGPTGVGKTELVKALAETLFGRDDALIRLDMSEYMESHTVSKLIGSPPGYVGYDDGGQLTEQVRRKPYSVILLDEIEKAHADVFNMLLQILDDGRLTDSHGKTVSFENTVIVMTSNAGTTLKSSGFGFGNSGYQALESRVMSVLEEMFRPEFLNRVDEIIVFNELTPEEIREIINLMLKDIEREMQDMNLKILLSEAVKDKLSQEGYDQRYGARPLRKTLQRRIEDPLAELFLEGKLEGKTAVSVRLKTEVEEGEDSPAVILETQSDDLQFEAI